MVVYLVPSNPDDKVKALESDVISVDTLNGTGMDLPIITNFLNA